MMPDKQVITIAVGKKLFVDMACNLALSFLHWHQNSSVKFYLYTDVPDAIPNHLKHRINVVHLQKGSVGEGFSSKLFLDEMAPGGCSIFIDSDCLIFSNLEHLFDRFGGKAVSVVGDYISDGEWFGDIKNICQKVGIKKMPKFNGGLYYLQKGEKATAVFNTARKLERQYNDIGFIRLRGRPNDEVLMSVAMELNGETPLIDDGTIMSDPQACPGGYYIDVLAGKCWLINPTVGEKNHQGWYPFHKVSPAIVHFLGYYTEHYPYRREVYRLNMLAQQKQGWFTDIKAFLAIQAPQQAVSFLKQIFRPVYHLLFGYRKIRQSDRVV